MSLLMFVKNIARIVRAALQKLTGESNLNVRFSEQPTVACQQRFKGFAFPVCPRLEICQQNYTTRFLVQKCYTLKVHNLRLFLIKKKQRKCINYAAFLLELNLVCQILTFSEQNHIWCV